MKRPTTPGLTTALAVFVACGVSTQAARKATGGGAGPFALAVLYFAALASRRRPHRRGAV